MQKSLQIAACVVPFLFVYSAASVAGVIYNESVSGDLSNDISSSTTNVGTLAAGDNLVIGTLDGGATGSTSDGTDEFDTFRFTVLSDWALNVDSFSGSGIIAFLYSSAPTLLTDAVVTSAPNDNLLGMQTAGTYYIGLVPLGNQGRDSYQIDLQTVTLTVPEPATLALFGLGLLGLGFSRRKG